MSARRRRSAIGLPFWWLRGGVIPDGSDLSTIAERQLAQGVYAISESDPANLTVTLKQGATTISTQSFAAIASTPTTSSWNLSAGERALITDWSALRVELAKTGGQVDVFDVSLSAPAAEVNTVLSGTPASGVWGVPTAALQVQLALTGAPPALGTGVSTATLALTAGLTGSPASALWGAPAGTISTAGTATLTGSPAGLLAGAPTQALAIQVALSGAAAGATFGVPANPLAVGVTLTATLLEGTTPRASWQLTPGATTSSALTLTTGERDAIGDWGNLRVQVEKSGAQIDVYDISLATPAPVVSTALTGSPAGALAKVPAGTFFVGVSETLTGAAARALWAVPTGTLTPQSPTLEVELLEGAAVRATRVLTAGAAAATETLALTAGEAAAITNWANLRVRLTQSVDQVVVYDVQLEAPDSAAATVLTGSAAGALWAVPPAPLAVQLALTGTPGGATAGVPTNALTLGLALTGTPAAGVWGVPTGVLDTSVPLTGSAPGAVWGVPTGTLVSGLTLTGSPAGAVWAIPAPGTLGITLAPLEGVPAAAIWRVAGGVVATPGRKIPWEPRPSAPATVWTSRAAADPAAGAWTPRPTADAATWTPREEDFG